jgi:hypothetical protein
MGRDIILFQQLHKQHANEDDNVLINLAFVFHPLEERANYGSLRYSDKVIINTLFLQLQRTRWGTGV